MGKVMDVYYVRWMIRRDMPEVLNIENDSFEFPWSEETFLQHLRQRNVLGYVAEHRDEVSGYMVYELHKHRIHLLSLAVGVKYRHSGVGSTMVRKLISKLKHQHRTRICLEVRESNLAGQLFFKGFGFVATGVARDFYEDTDEAAYTMEYRHESIAMASANRIARLYEN